jgi:hypothetical protein
MRRSCGSVGEDYSIDLEREGWMGVVDVCGLWFGITIGELKTKERRGGVRGKSGRGGMGGDGWHDSDIV